MSVAMVFPGQGSQSVGMLGALAAQFPTVAQTFATASDVLGFDLWDLIVNGPEQRLAQTQITQPAMLAAGVAVWRVWRESGGPLPSLSAGHSLGEYSALVAAQVLSFEHAVALVADRARFMQHAVPQGEGGIAAVLGLDDEQVVAICQQVSATQSSHQVSAVNFNAPGQVVIAGHRDAVMQAIESAKQAGARRAIALPMSVPVHCELMRPAAESLRASLARAEFHAPAFDIVHNADLALHKDANEIQTALVAQLYTPVRWRQTVLDLVARGATCLIECGPGKVLAGLNRRIDRTLATYAVHDPDSLGEALKAAGASR